MRVMYTPDPSAMRAEFGGWASAGNAATAAGVGASGDASDAEQLDTELTGEATTEVTAPGLGNHHRYCGLVHLAQ